MSEAEVSQWRACLEGLSRQGVRSVRMDAAVLLDLWRELDPLGPFPFDGYARFYRNTRLLERPIARNS